jgi:hypothetical protein
MYYSDFCHISSLGIGVKNENPPELSQSDGTFSDLESTERFEVREKSRLDYDYSWKLTVT